MTAEPTDSTTELATDRAPASTAGFTDGVTAAVPTAGKRPTRGVAAPDDPSPAGEFGAPAAFRHARFDPVREQA
ncbi:hypothetical protein [Streptomyces sp. NPDC059466]|uniref:hypothetical protein n=1 Tax=unclassified Streptomyces TaxID=2593676 RepID=UPI003685072B